MRRAGGRPGGSSLEAGRKVKKMRCHPIVLLAGLLTVVRAQGQSARHPSSNYSYSSFPTMAQLCLTLRSPALPCTSGVPRRRRCLCWRHPFEFRSEIAVVFFLLEEDRRRPSAIASRARSFNTPRHARTGCSSLRIKSLAINLICTGDKDLTA